MITKESAFQKISELVERFEEQYTSYMRSEYNETLTRRDFIDPFFKALGWDMDNEQGYAEAYREVIHEDRLRIGTATKAPDYSFKLAGGKRLFFVEAKKPGVSVKDEIQPAYQIRRYGWSAKLPISIITDFQELSIYDCTVKPNPTDKASVARIGYLTFHEYLTKFDFIWDTFSKERVLKGSFDRFVQIDTQKKGTATVDKEFLQSLDRWRTYLATSISWNNKELDEDEINFAVQQTIDRIIFLRIAEDRSVEPYGNLKHALSHGDYYQNLFEQFKKADEKYNSGLFDFQKDRICEHLRIDNKVIKTLINEMYYPECPYEFSVLSVEILGSAYEQFLGKVIRITPAHHAKIEEKPEVRKAGGVYYTPQYIVEYIVKNTVGKLVDGKTPADVSEIKIVDPACGSGSFLIGAYQYLLDWHLNYYNSSPGLPVSLSPGQDKGTRRPGDKGKSVKVLTPDGNLTTAEKKRILLNNIYGVDIDVNAVEVTKLSLLLKCLEGETEASIQQQFSLWNERVLPMLDNNIKSGNSLIDTDFYAAELDFGLEKKIKPFNWQNAFPEVFKQGGFDAVIGNPPWGAEFQAATISYIKSKLVSANERSFDSYSAFTEKALKILCPSGRMGFITPDTFLRKDDFYEFRKHLLQNYSIYEIVETGPLFSQVRDTWCCLLFIQKMKPSIDTLIDHKKISRFVVSVEERLEKFGNMLWDSTSQILQDVWINNRNMIVAYKATKVEQKIIKKLELNPELGTIQNYKLSRGEEGSKFNIKESDTGTFKMVIPADIKVNHTAEGKSIDIKGLTPNKLSSIYTHPKIWVTRIQKMRWEKRIVSAIDTRRNSAGMKTLQSITSVDDNVTDLYLLQAILSSKIINFYCTNYLADDMNQSYLSKIPIVVIKESDLNGIKFKEEIIRILDIILKLKIEIKSLTLESDLNQMQSKIDYHENRINEIVYQLYGLTEEEIRIVEGK